MPIVAKSITETTTVSVPQPPIEQSVALDTFVITQVSIGLPPNDVSQTRIAVQLERGYMALGKFVSVKISTVELRGAELLKAMGEAVIPGATHYEDFKQTVYAILQARGDIPAGDVV